MGCLLLLLNHPLAFRNLLCSVHHIHSWLPKQYFVPYMVMIWPWFLCVNLKFQKCYLQFQPVSLIDKISCLKVQLLPDTFEIFFSTFAHVVTSILRAQIVSNTYHCPSKSFPLTKTVPWYIRIELWVKNCNLAQIWSCDELDLWSLNLIFSETLNTASTSPFDWQKFLPDTLNWS